MEKSLLALMIYLKNFIFPSEHSEEIYLDNYYSRGSTYHTNIYPFRVLSGIGMFRLDFEPITILYGGNGSMDKDEDAAIQLFEKAATLNYPLSILWLSAIYKERGDKEKHAFWMEEYKNSPYKISEIDISKYGI